MPRSEPAGRVGVRGELTAMGTTRGTWATAAIAGAAMVMCAAWPVLAAGPVVFTKGVMEDVAPEDLPSPDSVVKRIELIACPGEFEPFSLAVRGSSDGSLTWAVSDLRRKGGAGLIPSSAVEIAPVVYGEAEGHLGKYGHVKDYILQPRQTGTVVLTDRTGWLWLTVGVPADAAAGRYEGTVTLKVTETGATTVLPLTVEVLPIRLAGQRKTQFALLFTAAFGQYHTAQSRAKRRPAALSFYKQLKDHGMTCIAPKCSDWPYKPGRFDGLAACVEAAREAGLTGPVIWYMSSLINATKGGRRYAHYDGKCDNWLEKRDLANLARIVTDVRKLAKDKGWGEIRFMTIDEPGTQTGDLDIRRLRMGTILPKTLKAVDDLGARGVATMSEPVDDKHNRRWVTELDELRKLWDVARPYCHTRIYGYGHPQGRTGLAFEQADCRKRGHEMWWYYNPASMGKNRYAARVYFGLWGWKVAADGLTAWTYPGGRTVQFELIREGIDDWKYLSTLERLVQTQRGAQKDRRAAKEFLDALKAGIEVDANGYVSDWAQAARAATNLGRPDAGKRPADFPALKRRLAGLIRALAR